jgi:hypothetical protein
VKATINMLEGHIGDAVHGATSGIWSQSQRQISYGGRILDALPSSMHANLKSHTVDEAMERFAGVGYGVDRSYQVSHGIGGPDTTTALLPGGMARTERFAIDTNAPTMRDIRVGGIDGMQHSGLIAGQRSKTTDFGSPRLGMKVSGGLASQLVGRASPAAHRFAAPSAFSSKTISLMHGIHDLNIRRGFFNSGGMLSGMFGGTRDLARGWNGKRGNKIGR